MGLTKCKSGNLQGDVEVISPLGSIGNRKIAHGEYREPLDFTLRFGADALEDSKQAM
jgi:hypothetical protein